MRRNVKTSSIIITITNYNKIFVILKKKNKIAYLSLSIKRSYNVKVSKLRILSDN